MNLRRVDARDLEALRALRNRSRGAFFFDEEIAEEQQQEWFERLRVQPVAFYAIEEDGAVVGSISVTERDGGRELGNVILDEAYRGRGLMGRAIEALTTEPGHYFAVVKPDNKASLALFRRAGFVDRYVRLDLERV